MDKPKYDERHGGPYDRGSADSYYGRPFAPHYYKGPTRQSELVEDLTDDDLAAYTAGYEYNEQSNNKKDWGYDD